MPFLALFLTLALAQNASVSGHLQDQRLRQIQTRCSSEINNRVTLLNNLSSRVTTTIKLSETQKNDILSQISSNVSNLLVTKAKCESDTDVEAARADSAAVFTTYRVYAVFAPQIRLLVASDSLQVTIDNLQVLYTSLAAKSSSGLLNDIKTKITDAQTQTTLVQTTVASLNPDTFNNNSKLVLSSFKTAETALKTGAEDARAAFSLARQIRSQL
jgi:hypothetical protein